MSRADLKSVEVIAVNRAERDHQSVELVQETLARVVVSLSYVRHHKGIDPMAPNFPATWETVEH